MSVYAYRIHDRLGDWDGVYLCPMCWEDAEPGAWADVDAQEITEPVEGEGCATCSASLVHNVYGKARTAEPSPVFTVKAIDIFGVVHDTYATEAELNGWRPQQGTLL